MSLIPPALSIDRLTVDYRSRSGDAHRALDGVSLTVAQGETVALVGESGSGKTTLGLAALGLLGSNAAATFDSFELGGVRLTGWRDPAWRQVRGRDIALIPQDPGVSLNPVRRIGSQLIESLVVQERLSRSAALVRAAELLESMGIDEPVKRLRQYPHELSGGMQQRVLIAMAFSTDPKLIVADEPTSGLDVTVQKKVLDYLDAAKTRVGSSVLLITHDLAVAADRADRILVLQGGAVVEQGAPAQIVGSPQHAYTRQLVDAAPSLGGERLRPAAGRDMSSAVQRGASARLIVQDARKSFAGAGARASRTQALDGVSIEAQAGSTVAIVGESGSGKSTLARVILGLERPDQGTVVVDGIDVGGADRAALRRLHQQAQLVYQNPYTSLDPRFTIEQIIGEPLRNFRGLRGTELRRRVAEALDSVALPSTFLRRKPSELSGGQRQRVAIARAIAPRPKLVVLDEPVSALDVSVQAQILQLLVDVQAEFDLSYVFISHDLAVVRLISDTAYVMRTGVVVEHGPTSAIFDAPQHDYTRRLLDAIPGTAIPRFERSAS